MLLIVEVAAGVFLGLTAFVLALASIQKPYVPKEPVEELPRGKRWHP